MKNQRKSAVRRRMPSPPAVPVPAAAASAPRTFVTVQRAAEISGESPWSWRARAYRGLIESCKPQGPKSRLLIPLDEVERFLAAGLRPRAVA
jgi:hypothetical protein